jgi:uncharacterized membrane protein
MNQDHPINLKPALLFSAALVLLMFLVSAAVWFQIPGDKIPVHWGMNGEPDRYGSKFEGLLLTPLISVGLLLLFAFLPMIEPRRLNLAKSQKVYKIIAITLMLFLALLHTAIVFAALGRDVEMNLIAPPLVGLMMVIMGNFMGKIRSNFFVGIRTPWTLSSELSWNKTHRLGGKIMVIFGFIMIVAPFIIQGPVLVGIILGGAIGMVTTMFVYSYVIWKNDPERNRSAT